MRHMRFLQRGRGNRLFLGGAGLLDHLFMRLGLGIKGPRDKVYVCKAR